MKKITIKRFIIFLVIGIAIGYGITVAIDKYKEYKRQQEYNREKDISGIITDASMNNLTIDYQGNIYTFSTMDVDMSNVTEVVLGDTTKITYTGLINKTEDFQTDVQVKKVDITVVEHDTYPDYVKEDGIFSEYYKQAYDKMSTMSTDEKIGQLFLVRVPASNAQNIVSQYQFGGYILFGRDTENKTKDELINNIKSYQSVSKIPLIIATDEEGGIVVRVSNNSNLASEAFKSPQELYNEGGYSLIKQDTITKGNLLSSLGINVNLAPVADVSTNSSDYIYSRSFGKDATQTSKYVSTVISASHETSTSFVMKHFPGYGNNADTHTGISIDNRSLDSFKKSDFLPFEAGIKENGEAILVNHNIIVNIENNIPASLSPKVHNILRSELGFTGIIMTDDLAMDAIKNYVEKPSVQALKSGNYMIIITDYEEGIKEIKEALNSGTIGMETVNKAVTRILAWKYYKKMM